MNIEISNIDKAAIVTVQGRVDTITAPMFQESVLELIDKGENIIVFDLENMEYISSAGLSAFLVAAKTAKAAGGGVACSGLQEMVKQVFEVSGFMAVLPFYETKDKALESLK